MAKNIIEKFLKNKSKMSKLRRTITCLAAVVVFATTYALILPAMTLDGSDAQKTPGIDTKTEINVEKFGQSLGGDQDSGSDVADNAAQAVNSEEKDVSGGEGALQSEGNGEEAPEAAMNSEGEKANGSDSKVGSDNKANDVKDGAKKDTAGSKDSKTADDNKDKKGGSKDLSLITEKTEIKFDGKGYKVIAEVGADAKLPADTKLKVREIKDGDKNENGKEYAYDAYCDEALKAVRDKDGEDGEDLKRQVKLYDIKFVSESADTDKVEPAAPVKVTAKYDEAVKRSDKNVIRAVHFDDTDLDKDKAAEAMIDKDKLHDVKKVVLETKSEKNDADSMKDVQFKSDRFSVYGIVYTVNAEEQKKEQKEEQKAEDSNIRTLTANGKKYDVTVSFGEEANIPENAELRVKEIKEEDKEYKAVQEKAGDELSKKIKKQIPQHPVLFDIAIYDGDEEIEPAKGSSVKVEVKMNKDSINGVFTDEDSPLLINDEPVDAEEQKMNQKLKVIHDVKDGELEVVDIEENNTKKKIVGEFETESFSNWLLYLDDEFENNEITVHVGDSLTLRPYGQWYWKKDGEPADLQALNWLFPSNDYNTTTGSQTVPTNYSGGTATYQGITQAKTKDGKYTFSGNAKYDRELQEPYWFYNAENLNQPGEFKLYIGTQSGVTKTITVKVIEGESSQKPGTVEGLSNIKVNLFDYDNGGVLDEGRDWQGNINKNLANNVFNNTINVGHPLKFLSSGAGNQNNGAGLNDYTNQSPHQGLVNNKLGSDKFPHLSSSFDSNQSSLGYLFDTSKTWGNSGNSIQAYPNVTGLFQQDSDGYYYYNSNANYAEYDKNSNKMILYEHTYTQDTEGSNGANAKPIGFFPFHEYDSMNDLHVNQNKNLNHHLGMSMEVGFTLPSNKLTDDGEHIRYEFSGDDDLWVYVDDDLVLDIGGIHQPVRGYIDFTEGKVYVYNVNGGQPKEIAAVKNLTTGEEHKLRMFYLERGGCDSNLSVRFNLPLIPTASVSVAKYDKSASPVAPLQGVKFAVYSNPQCTNKIGDYTSDSNGLIKIEDLQIRDGNTRYYLKETKPLSGYKQDETVYTLVPELVPQSPKKYEFKIFDGEEEITTIGQNPAYPVLYNEQAKPIDLTVEKQWKNKDGGDVAIPSNASATFKLQRYERHEGEKKPDNSILKVYRINAAWDQSSRVLEETRTFAGNSKATVNWTFDSNMGSEWKDNPRYKIGDGDVQSPSTASATVDLTAGETVELYIQDGNMGGQWQQYRVRISNITGVDPSEAEPVHYQTDWALDNGYNNADNVPTITLPETDTDPWKGMFQHLTVLEDKDDGNTYQYKYYIVENGKTPSDAEVVYVDGNGQTVSDPATLATDSNGTQTVVNKVPVGNLRVTKELLGDVTGSDYASKEFKVTIKDSNNKYLQSDQKSFGDSAYQFTVTQNSPLEITGIPTGQYTVTEVRDGVEINGYLWNTEESNTSGSVTVAENETARVELKNYYDEIYTPEPSNMDVKENLKINKKWDNHVPTDNDEIQVKIKVKSAEAYVPVRWDLYDAGTGNENDKNALSGTYYVEPGSAVGFTVSRASNSGTAFKRIRLNSNVSLWGESGVAMQLTNRVPSDNASQKGYAPNNDTFTYTARDVNAENPVEYKLQPWHEGSKWIDGAPSSPGEWNMSVNVEAGKRYYSSVTTMRDALINEEPTTETLVYSMKSNTAPQLVESLSSCNIRPESVTGSGWSIVLNGLPTYQRIATTDNGVTTHSYKVYSYEVEEIYVNGKLVSNGKTDDYQVGYESSSAADEAGKVTTTTDITNTELSTSVQLMKTDEKANSTNYLSGAVFELLYKEKAGDIWQKASSSKVTQLDENSQFVIPGNEGGITLTGLKAGFYKLVEIKAPAGYVITNVEPVVFEIKQGKIDNTRGTANTVTYTPASAASASSQANPATFKIPNEPGAALPSAGGPGTTWIYLLGAMLTLGAGMSLVVRRRMSV